MIPSFIHRRYRAETRVTLGWTRLALGFALAWVTLVCAVRAEEQWKPFLESLRESGYHDMAILYLDRMADRSDCPADLREILDYERGITILSQSASSRAEQEKNLAEAGKLFEAFCKKHPKHEYVTKAQAQRANVLIEQGRMLAGKAEEPGVTPKEQTNLATQARGFYTKAKEVFQKQDTLLTAELKKLPEPKATAEISKVDAIRADFLQTRLSLATAEYEIGLTYPQKSPKRSTSLKNAAKQYYDLYDKYGSFLAGLYARMWEGRCHQKLGDSKEALDVFESILMQGDDSRPFRTLKNKTTILVMETLTDPKVKRYADALQHYEAWEKEQVPSDLSSPEGLQIRYLSAVASLELARSLKPTDKLPGKMSRQKLLTGARASLNFLMRFPSETRNQAREKLADPLLVTEKTAQNQKEPQDFTEAKDLGREALDKIQIAEVQSQVGRKKLSAKQLEKITRDAELEASGYFQKAIQLAEPDTPVDEVNQVRYYLAYLAFKRGDLYDAAVFADYLGRHFPGSAVGRPAAKLAMAAFVGLSADPQATEEAKTFADRRAEQAAAYIIEVWPGSEEANDSRKVFLHAALRSKDLKKAIELIESIPTEAQGRGSLETIVGRSLYAEYVRRLTQKNEAEKNKDGGKDGSGDGGMTGVPTQPELDPVELDRLLKQAKEMLLSGVKASIQERKIDRSFFAGELTLVRIYLNEGENGAAVRYVTAPTTGLLAIADAADPAIIEGGLDIEAYKTALRVLVASQQLDKAKKVKDQLERRVAKSDQSGGSAQLMQIYVSLAQELKQTLDELQKSGRAADVARTRKSFVQFLDEVSRGTESTSFNVMQWIATTYGGLAESFPQADDDTLSSEAKKYYEKSAAEYEKILKRAAEDKAFAPSSGSIDAVRVRLAICLKKLGRYEDALKQLYTILTVRNAMVDAQVEAAYTYQTWAGTKGKGKLYLNAMLGAMPQTKDGAKVNVFWGWGMLSKRLSQDTKHRELFHEARYNLSVCRYRYAISGECPDPKKYLDAAQRDLKILSRLYPDMGGEAMKAKYLALNEKISEALKK